MAHLDLVAALVDKLYDVETILRFNNLRHALRVGEVERNRSKGWVEHTATNVVHLAALTCRAWVFGVEACERSERSLAACDAVGIFAQLVLHVVDFLLRNLRLLCDYLYLNLRRNERNAVLWQLVEVFAYVSRRNGDVAHEFLAHLLYELVVAEVVVQLLAHLRNGHLLVFLQFLLRTSLLYPAVYLHLYVLRNLSLSNVD